VEAEIVVRNLERLLRKHCFRAPVYVLVLY